MTNWKPVGGPRAHCGALRALGWKCVGLDQHARHMQSPTGLVVPVPLMNNKRGKKKTGNVLPDATRDHIMQYAGVGRERYIEAFRSPNFSFGCPPKVII